MPLGGITIVEANGEHRRSLQNEPIQPFGKPFAVKATRLPAGPLTASRYLIVLAIEPGKSGPVHGASDRPVAPCASLISSATVASCDCSRYMTRRESLVGMCSAAASAAVNSRRARVRSPRVTADRPPYKCAQATCAALCSAVAAATARSSASNALARLPRFASIRATLIYVEYDGPMAAIRLSSAATRASSPNFEAT